MANLSNEEQWRLRWRQEYELLKAYGFKWRLAGIVEGKKQWQLFTPVGTPISKYDALAEIAREEGERKREDEELERMAQIEASMYDVFWKGSRSAGVMDSREIVSISEEGDSYAMFPPTVQVTEKGYTTRYKLPSGTVFIMKESYRGKILVVEGEEGY